MEIGLHYGHHAGQLNLHVLAGAVRGVIDRDKRVRAVIGNYDFRPGNPQSGDIDIVVAGMETLNHVHVGCDAVSKRGINKIVVAATAIHVIGTATTLNGVRVADPP